MVLLYMVTWIPSIYPIHVSIYTSTMDPMGYEGMVLKFLKPIPEPHGAVQAIQACPAPVSKGKASAAL